MSNDSKDCNLQTLRQLLMQYPDEAKFFLLTHNQIKILRFIKSYEHISTAQLALQFNLSVQSASGQLKRLYERGYLKRTEAVQSSGGLEYLYAAISS